MDGDKKKFLLSNLKLDEVSLVDFPANQHADVLIVKCGAPEETSKKKSSVDGIKFVLGFTEDGNSEVQSVVFDTEKWSVAEAKAWLKENELSSAKVDEKENSIRFRQKDPSKYKRFRTISPGARTAKALRTTGMSVDKIRSLVQAAIYERYQKSTTPDDYANYIFTREFYDDTVIFEQAGKLWGVEFDIEDNAVTITDRVEVEVRYFEVSSKAAAPPPPEQEPKKEYEPTPFELRLERLWDGAANAYHQSMKGL